MLLSIIIPIYNGSSYINDLILNIESVNEIIRDDIEILLINDGSTDNSLDICYTISKQYSNIKVYTKDNGGIASARNYGLEKSSGKYVAFMDQDDGLSEGYHQYLKRLDESEADILITDEVYNRITEKERRGYVKSDEICNKERINMLLRTILNVEGSDVFSKYNCCPPTIWNCIFRRDLIFQHNIKLFSFVDYEDDWLFMINTLSHANKVIFSKEPYYLWTISESSHSHRHRYIDNLQNKRCQLDEYTLSIMKKIGIDGEIIARKRLQKQRECIIKVFYNATNTPYRNFKKEMSSVINNLYSEALIIKGKKGIILQNLYLKMFQYGIYIIPYVMNRYFLKKTFQ